MLRDDALSALADRWRDASPKELANAQSYVIELCEALGVERPRPSGSGYEFELGVTIVHWDGTFDALMGVEDVVYPVEREDVDWAKKVLDGLPGQRPPPRRRGDCRVPSSRRTWRPSTPSTGPEH